MIDSQENAVEPAVQDQSFLHRYEVRLGAEELKRTIVFGIVLGWLILLFFGFQWYLTRNLSDTLMFAFMILGAVVLVVTLVYPTVLIPVERVWMKFGSYIGMFIFGLVLAIVYLAAITPMGMIQRFFSGTKPFYSWDPDRGEATPAEMEGWSAKVIPAEIEASARQTALDDGTGQSHLPLVLQPLRVVAYFARQGQWAIIPIIFFLLALGLLMFFVQTSAVAPFIYTLF